MKLLIVFLCCAVLGLVAVRADEFHLVETAVYDEPLTPANGPATNSVYVLLLPVHHSEQPGNVVLNPVVLRKFDAKQIGNIISGAVARGFLPKGSILHVDPSPEMVHPLEAEIKTLRDACEKAGVTVVVSATM